MNSKDVIVFIPSTINRDNEQSVYDSLFSDTAYLFQEHCSLEAK